MTTIASENTTPYTDYKLATLGTGRNRDIILKILRRSVSYITDDDNTIAPKYGEFPDPASMGIIAAISVDHFDIYTFHQLLKYVASQDSDKIFQEMIPLSSSDYEPINLSDEKELILICCSNGSSKVLQAIIDSGVDISDIYHECLETAIVGPNVKCLDLIKMLKELGAELRYSGDDLLRWAMNNFGNIKGDLHPMFLDRIIYLLDEGVSPFSNDNACLSAILQVTSIPMLELLINCGLDVNSPKCVSLINEFMPGEKMLRIFIDNGLLTKSLSTEYIRHILQYFEWEFIEEMINTGLDIQKIRGETNPDNSSKIIALEAAGFTSEEIVELFLSK